MLHYWKTVKAYGNEAGLWQMGLLKIFMFSLGVLIGLCLPRHKKMKTGMMAAGLLALTGVPLLNKFFDISDALAEDVAE